MAHAFNSGTWEAEADLSEFEASLVYQVSSRTATIVTQRTPVLKNKQTDKQKGRKVYTLVAFCVIFPHMYTVYIDQTQSPFIPPPLLQSLINTPTSRLTF